MPNRNVELTGLRYRPHVSAWARDLNGLRHLDLDLYQYCHVCGQPELVAEVKKTTAKKVQWEQTRLLGRALGCWSCLIIEAPGTAEPDTITVWARNLDFEAMGKRVLTREEFSRFLWHLHDEHLRRGHNMKWFGSIDAN